MRFSTITAVVVASTLAWFHNADALPQISTALPLPSSPPGLPAAAAIIAHGTAAGADYCCAALSFVLGSKVSYPLGISYISSLATYWSQQESQLVPSCIVSPKSTQDVSAAVYALSLPNAETTCKFAIRSAGHTPWAGAANIQSGVTIDLGAMKAVNVNAARTVTSIEPGARWVDVYLKLDAMSLAVPGGRVADVGVGGLVTGGGFSYFSPRYGFVCDNVVNYEVVLASGQVVNANATSNPDLWFALKGGSNNFGVVTRFDLNTFSQGKLWGGLIYHTITTREQQFQAFAKLNSAPKYDTYAALINSYAYTPGTGWLIANCYEYTKPEAYPPVFNDFTSLQPQLLNTMRISNLSDFTVELMVTSPPGSRDLFATATYGNSASFLSKFFDLSNSTLQPIKNIIGLKYSISYQPIPTVVTSHAAENGGNALGLDPSDGNLVLVLLGISWLNAADDTAVNAQAKNLFSQANALASSMGLLNEWIYLNYASEWQDPIDGYGAANKAKLQAVSEKYDPTQVFQKQVPGGYKLFT